MKELTIEEKAQAYDEALSVALETYQTQPMYRDWLKKMFPELAESEDEKIRKALVRFHKSTIDVDGIKGEKILAWLEKRGNLMKALQKSNARIGELIEKNYYLKEQLEKQGEQKSKNESTDTCDSLIIKSKEFPASEKQDFGYFSETTDKVEPKFKVGDWITNGDYTWKIVEVKPLDYILQSQNGNIVDDTISHVDEQFHSFDIEDAKNGDVLASNHSIFIFSQEYIAGKPEAHCGIMNGLFIVKPEGCWTNEKYYPATKEQQDILYQKMNEEGYEWNCKKKELRKIDQKPTENRQEIKLNGGIVWEDFNEGDGYYKMNLAYLSKSQVEFIENLVTSWQNPTNNASAWNEEDEKILDGVITNYESGYLPSVEKRDEIIEKLKSLKDRYTWKPSNGQLEALWNVYQGGEEQAELATLYNDLKKLKE